MTNKSKELKRYSNLYRVLNRLSRYNFFRRIRFSITNKGSRLFKRIPISYGLGKEHLVDNEAWMNLVLKEYLKDRSDKIFIDVGVNLGQTLIKVKETFPEIDYIGFEPNPFCVNYLLELISINQIEGVRLVPAALSNERGCFELLMDNDSIVDSAASIINTYRKGKSKRMDVVVVCPDDISFLKSEEIGVIKIDVEGAEYEVLDGFRSLIHKNKPLIIIEILPVYSKENEDRYRRQLSIEELIQEIGYLIYRINESTGTLISMESIGIHGDLNQCNYLLMPKND